MRVVRRIIRSGFRQREQGVLGFPSAVDRSRKRLCVCWPCFGSTIGPNLRGAESLHPISLSRWSGRHVNCLDLALPIDQHSWVKKVVCPHSNSFDIHFGRPESRRRSRPISGRRLGADKWHFGAWLNLVITKALFSGARQSEVERDQKN